MYRYVEDVSFGSSSLCGTYSLQHYVQYYSVTDGTPTGVCGVIITDKERSMVTNLEAANKFSKSHLDSDAVSALVSKVNGDAAIAEELLGAYYWLYFQV